MEEQAVGTLTFADLKAEIYSSNLPGEFKIVYRDASGSTLAEEMLSGVSTYRQREPEIMSRLQQLSQHGELPLTSELADAGEY